MSKHKKSGFTLVEILITVAVIAIIAAVIGVSLSIVKKNSNDSRRVGDIKEISKALELYYDKYAYYPGRLDELVGEGFLKLVPVPPLGGKQQFYTYVPLGGNQICTGYHLGAAMEMRGSDFLNNDADAYSGTPCAKADGPDFDGTASDCAPGIAGEGVKNDNCYDVKI